MAAGEYTHANLQSIEKESFLQTCSLGLLRVIKAFEFKADYRDRTFQILFIHGHNTTGLHISL